MVFYSHIPEAERAEWSDDELSGAIWDEAVALAGGYSFTVADVARLPFGFRCALSEGSVRGHIEGDGLSTAIWNDNGVAMIELAASCHRQIGNIALSDLLTGVCEIVHRWQRETGQTPRSLHGEFVETPLCQELDSMSDSVMAACGEGFSPMMKYLRANPELFQS